ncbi:MAG TPA: hypothetical protein VL137_03670 [Polyangiaceae bacterium]|nr:hypothetical protein [Polyangiaceae bacterium]
MRTYLLIVLVGLIAIAGCTPTSSSPQDAGTGPDATVTHTGHGNGGSGSGGGNKDASTAQDASLMSDATMSSLDASLDAMSLADSGMSMGDAGDAGDAASPGVADPAPQAASPGAYTCPGCPDAAINTFQINAGASTSQAFTGTVTGAIGDGEFYLESTDGQTIGGAIPTDVAGNYSFTLPLFCGTQLLKCLWSNAAGTYVAVVQIITDNCIPADIRLTLTWDNLGLDYELHLIKQGGHINDNATDCTWTSCLGAGPDWGVLGDATDNPLKDVDNTGNYGPENIFYAKPEDGTYTVMVEHWGAGTPDSDGQVTINLLGQKATVVPIMNLASHHVFTAATIDWPSKVVTPVETDYDCTATWAGGCTAAIP